jgi:hypothetical protein
MSAKTSGMPRFVDYSTNVSMRFHPKTRLIAMPPSASEKLDSWKAIAAYLGRDPRTVQLWEKAEGLPVHRLNHRARPTVYAYTAEIEEWLRARSTSGHRKSHIPALHQPVVRAGYSRLARAFLYGLVVLICVGILAVLLLVIHHRLATTG